MPSKRCGTTTNPTFVEYCEDGEVTSTWLQGGMVMLANQRGDDLTSLTKMVVEHVHVKHQDN